MALVVLLMAGGVVLALSHIDLVAVGGALRGADPALLGVAVGAYLLGQTLSGAMWAVSQRSGGVTGITMGRALGMHWVARAACEVLPASLGEGVRIALVRRHPAGAAAGTWRIAGGVAGYKLLDAAVTGLAVMAIMVASPLPGPAAGLRWTALGAIGVVVILVVLWRVGVLGRATGLLPGRARSAVTRIGEGARVVTDPGAARTAGLFGVAAVLARIVSLGALLAAFGAPAAAAGLAFAVIVLSGAIPGAPGGAGARELVLVPALAMAHGVATETALAFSVAIQATALAATLAAAAVAALWLGLSRSEAEVVPVAPEAAPEPETLPAA